MSRYEPRVFVARKSVDVLLAGEPSRYQLVCRINAIRRLAEDCERFFPLPSLVASLQYDIARLGARLEAFEQ